MVIKVMRSTLINLTKNITIPKLSPSHTSARIIQFLATNNRKVESYNPILILECSSDLIHDPADRKYPNEKLCMIVESMEEGIIKELNDFNGKWLDVGSVIGLIDDGDDLDGDWTWQAYLHDHTNEFIKKK